MRYLETARRLTGANYVAPHPLVQVELALDPGDDAARARDLYLEELGRMRVALGFASSVAGLIERPQKEGLLLAYVEPLDVMLACAEMTEWAAMSACEIMAGRPGLPLEPKMAEVGAILARDRSPRLTRLTAEARARGLPLLWDDDEVSIGSGRGSSAVWPRHALPDVSEVPWAELGRIPVALVTGTNGKTTSSRWLGRIAQEAGFHVGVTSSDAISVDGQQVDSGDCTGPYAARVVLRRKDVDFAVLETARGGILRRGLALDRCDVALLTNISDDHLGSYGIDDLEAMTEVKAVPAYAARTVVLNAADPRLAALATRLEDRVVVLFADLDEAPAARAIVEAHRGAVVVAEGGRILRGDVELGRVADIPLTFGGAARFNVANALGVAAAASALGLPDDAIRRGLVGFTPAENPRRSTLVETERGRVLLDFGHNPDGIRAVVSLARELRGPGRRLFVCLAGAGDRTDHELDEMARVVAEAGPHRVVVRELEGYLRGRQPGEVPTFLGAALARHGVAKDAIQTAASEVDSLRVALGEAQPGDFVVLLVHIDADAVAAFLAAHARS